MTEPPPSKRTFRFPVALLAIDVAALVVVGLCLAELFPKQGTPLGLIPVQLLWPTLVVASVVAAICALMQVRLLLRRNRQPSADEPDSADPTPRRR